MRYALGIAAAVVAGITINVGILIQNAAVGKVPPGTPLMRALLKSRLWWSALAFQFIFGSPLFVLSVGLIGPAIVPGLMSIGLVVLALGAVIVQKERLSAREGVGIGLVGCAVVAFGLSRLSIDTRAFSLRDGGLLLRAGVFTLVCAVTAVGCALAARRTPETRSERASALHAVRAGVWYTAGNLGLGFLTAGAARFAAGELIPAEIAVCVVACGLTAAGNLLGLAATQHALAHGRAAVAIPLQNGVSQILPVCIFFFVYRPYMPVAGSFVFLGAAVALLVTGIVLLTGRLAAAP
jgi:hypothetical protein